jgi:HEAT repeat protein
LIELIRRADVASRRSLVSELARRRTEPATRALVRLLESDSWHLRELAMNALPEVGALARPFLAPLLVSGLWYTRAAAARGVGKIGEAEFLPRLVEMLRDGNHTIEDAALASIADLVRLGHARETARLFWSQGAPHSEDFTRRLLAAHPGPGGQVAELLAAPASFLEAVPLAGEGDGDAIEEDAPDIERRNA